MSNPLEGFEVMDVPKRISTRAWMADAVLAFLKTGNKCMGKCFESNEEAYKAYRSAKSYIAYHKVEGVKASVRDDTLLLIRKEQ